MMSARDISAGGVFILTDTRWPKNSEVELVIAYGGVEIPVAGRVLRHEEDGVAMAFDRPGPKVRHAIRALLTSLFAGGAANDERRRRRRSNPPAADVVWMTAQGKARGSLEEVSLAGARIGAERVPAVNTVVYVFLPLKHRGRIDDIRGCEAKVMRHTDSGFAVEFVNAGVSFHEAIAMLVAD